jgi:hypothetical protein
MTSLLTREIAAAAARLVVEDGLEYGAAKRRAARDLTRGAVRPTELPDNDLLEDAVREYIAVFHADTQPHELAALRRLALHWMERLERFHPHLTGAVWRGTATAASAVHVELYADDPKAAEIAMIDARVDYRVDTAPGVRGEPVDRLVVDATCPELASRVPVCLTVLDRDDLRGRLRPDRQGRTERGDASALRRLIASTATAEPNHDDRDSSR